MDNSKSHRPSNKPNRESDSESERQPWKEDGYPALCAWMASSNDFFIIRRFTRTSARVLLWLQEEIARKERKLDAMDDFSRRLPGS